MNVPVQAAMIDSTTLVIILLCLAGAAALIGLLIVFIKIAGALSRVNKMLDDLAPSVKATADQLPETVVHINHTLGNVVDMTDSLADTVPALLNDVTRMTAAAGDTVESLTGVVQALADLLADIVDKLHKPVQSVLQIAKTIHKVSGKLSHSADKRIKRIKKKR